MDYTELEGENVEHIKLGHTDLVVSRIGFGGAAIGGLYDREISEEQAITVVHHALHLGMNFIDTAPAYGHGQSERYIGRALATYEGPTPIVATKAGRVHVASETEDVKDFDYSYDMTMASVEASLDRLGLDYLSLVHLHAVQLAPSVEYVLSQRGSLGALRRLQSQGVIGWIGVGCPTPIIAKYIGSGEVDVALVANQYDLLDRSATKQIFPLAVENDVGVVIGGVYGGGILATGPIPDAKYKYQKASREVLERVRDLQETCNQFGVSLKVAALHFCLRHPAVASVVLGTSSVSHVDEMIESLNKTVPEDLWEVI